MATISASSPITAQRDDNAVSLNHANSGVSAGAYGAASNVTADWGDTVTVGARMSVNATGHVTSAQGRTVTFPDNTATQSAKGLMSSTDKTKLDGIAQGANKTMVDSALSSTSTNPVQNKVINTALAGKAASSHTHAATQITGLTASRALATNSSGQVVVSAVTNTELSYLDGVTSAVQTQLNNKAAKTHTHNYAGSSSPGGAATSSNKLATARTIKLTGAVNGQATFDGSKDITINVEGDSAAAGFLAAHPPGTPYENENYIDMEGTYGGTWRYCPGFEFHRWVRET